MTRFIFSGVMVCPSDWTARDAAEFVKRQLLSTAEENASLMVSELTASAGMDAAGVQAAIDEVQS